MPEKGFFRRRSYIQARNLRAEAERKIKDYKAIMGRAWNDYQKVRNTGIPCRAFIDNENQEPENIQLTRQCWNHIFKHPIKRQSRAEKLERALCFDMAIKLLKKTTTYQEVSREIDKGGNAYLSFGIIGYVRGNRIKVVIKQQAKYTNAKKILFSFWQMSSAPMLKKEEEHNK